MLPCDYIHLKTILGGGSDLGNCSQFNHKQSSKLIGSPELVKPVWNM